MNQFRQDFPILNTEVRGKPLIYFDNAATTQKPQSVIDTISNFYQSHNANVHRGLHYLSGLATQDYDNARQTLQKFINAADPAECVFVRGATEGINLVANGFYHLKPGDEIIVSAMEHHSNIVPWQFVCERTGAQLKVVPILENGELDMEAYQQLLTEFTKVVAIIHVSNAIGTINPVKKITELAHAVGAKVLIDGAQATPHMNVDVQDIDCDFYVFSGHKMYGPTGIGVVYGKKSLLNTMAPYQGGGDMISEVSFEKSTFKKAPDRFEAGTPNIAGAIGLAAAVDYLTEVGLDAIAAHEQELLLYATQKIAELDDVTILGTAKHKAAVISYSVDNCHPHDVATILDHEGVAIRAGHHCAMPLIERFQVPATNRVSFGLYNTLEEIDGFIAAMHAVKEMMG